MSKISWMVCSGIDIKHFWDVKVFQRLKDAREYAKALPPIPSGNVRPYHIERWEWKDAKNYWGTEASSRIFELNY